MYQIVYNVSKIMQKGMIEEVLEHGWQIAFCLEGLSKNRQIDSIDGNHHSSVYRLLVNFKEVTR